MPKTPANGRLDFAILRGYCYSDTITLNDLICQANFDYLVLPYNYRFSRVKDSLKII